MYRVEKRILPVEFFLNIYSILQDINPKIGTDNSQVLSYDYFKAKENYSASVSVMTIIILS